MPDQSHNLLAAALGGRLVDRPELLRRLQQVLQSARELGSVHALTLLELEERDGAPPSAAYRLAEAMGQRIRQSDTLAEIGHRCYALLLTHCPLEKAIGVAGALLASCRAIHDPDDDAEPPCYRAVIGVVPFSAEAPGANELLGRGHRACRDAWALGGDRVQVFRSVNSDRARTEHEILPAVKLLEAIEQDRLRLWGQEIVPLKPGLPPYFEILLRMPDGNGGHLSPASFVLAAERYGLATRLDHWVVTEVLERYRGWFGDATVGVTINLSGQSVGDEELLRLVHELLNRHEIPAGCVCFEITETAAVRDVEQARAFISALRGLGCRFALDDFGSGQASFRYLKTLDLDFLKIDGSFVRGVSHRELERVLVESIHRIGQVLGIHVVAEGVETQEVLEEIRGLGMDYAQGYVHGRPCAVEQLARRATARAESSPAAREVAPTAL